MKDVEIRLSLVPTALHDEKRWLHDTTHRLCEILGDRDLAAHAASTLDYMRLTLSSEAPCRIVPEVSAGGGVGRFQIGQVWRRSPGGDFVVISDDVRSPSFGFCVLAENLKHGGIVPMYDNSRFLMQWDHIGYLDFDTKEVRPLNAPPTPDINVDVVSSPTQQASDKETEPNEPR